jgi:hypothetical protein
MNNRGNYKTSGSFATTGVSGVLLPRPQRKAGTTGDKEVLLHRPLGMLKPQMRHRMAAQRTQIKRIIEISSVLHCELFHGAGALHSK